MVFSWLFRNLLLAKRHFFLKTKTLFSCNVFSFLFFFENALIIWLHHAKIFMWKQWHFFSDIFCLSGLSNCCEWHIKERENKSGLMAYFFFSVTISFIWYIEKRRGKNPSLISATQRFDWCLLIWMSNTREALLPLYKSLSSLEVIRKKYRTCTSIIIVVFL